METFYHGTYRLFDHFDIAHLGDGARPISASNSSICSFVILFVNL